MKTKTTKVNAKMAKKIVNYSYFTLAEVGPIIAQLLGFVYDKECLYEEIIVGKDLGLKRAQIVDSKGNILIVFKESSNYNLPTYNFYSMKGKRVIYDRMVSYNVLKLYIDYVINYKLQNNLLYLDYNELKHLEKMFVRKHRLLYIMQLKQSIEFSKNMFMSDLLVNSMSKRK